MTTTLLNLDFKWQDTAGIQWNISDIGVNGVRYFDLDYRLSMEHWCEIPQTNLSIVNGAPTRWKMLKYENGFFKRHMDHQQNPFHCGVDVLIPPKSLCQYTGGELVIYSKDQEKLVSPHYNLWTMVRIPLGTAHQVRPVNGIRITFVRGVYSDKEFKVNLQGKGVEAILTD